MSLKMKSTIVLTTFLLFFVISIANINGQTANEWPRFHGHDFLNKSTETGLLSAWPEAGPSLAWQVAGIGEGYSSVTIADGLIYTSGKSENQTYVYAFGMDGKLVWKKPNGTAWDVQVAWASTYNGSRSTPTYDDGVIYHLSEAGRLSAYNSKTGDLIWARELTRDFQAEIPMYGFSESVTIDGNSLYVRPGGKTGFQVCLNKITGETIWVNNEIPGSCGYNSLVIKDLLGYRQVIGASSNCYYGVDSKTGKLLWKVDFENKYGVNSNDAIVFNEFIFLSTTQKGCMLIKLSLSGQEIITDMVWQTELMDNYHGGFVLHDGYVFGTGTSARSWFCLEFQTGRQMWKMPGSGSLTYADGTLYLYDEKGTMKLVKATGDHFENTGEFKVPAGGKGPYWAHPVVCGGRLYLRHDDTIFAYDIANK
jgi:outer membrane protein assembly factor BamB